jgi:polysaccharide deacetylase 2 family uncharacterized protein YibQ
MTRPGKRKNRGRRRKSRRLIVLLVSAGLIGVLIFFFLRTKPVERKVVQPIPPSPPPAAKVPEEGRKEKEAPPPPAARLALIIDDGGYSLERLKGLLGLGRPMTFAILPNLPHSRDAALLAHREGAEVMLHLPMEPQEIERYSLEKDTVLTGMEKTEIQAILHKGLKQIPHARGVNNHMGSKATEDLRVMNALMEVLKKEGLYYVDSHTSPRSAGAQAARRAGVAFAGNDRFIDHERDVEAIKKAIRLAMKTAKQEGKAVAIGHPHPSTVRAIREMVPEIESQGIRMVLASEVAG